MLGRGRHRGPRGAAALLLLWAAEAAAVDPVVPPGPGRTAAAGLGRVWIQPASLGQDDFDFRPRREAEALYQAAGIRVVAADELEPPDGNRDALLGEELVTDGGRGHLRLTLSRWMMSPNAAVRFAARYRKKLTTSYRDWEPARGFIGRVPVWRSDRYPFDAAKDPEGLAAVRRALAEFAALRAQAAPPRRAR